MALCGSVDHEGRCRWPHNNAIAGDRFRTVYVASADEPDQVAGLIEAALRGGDDWSVQDVRRRDLHDGERDLAARLAS